MPIWFTIDSDYTIDLRTSVTFTNSLNSARLTVEKIIENYPSPYYLMVSGGVDSQAMLYAWKLFGRDFIPTAVTYNDGLNSHDLTSLSSFAKREQIDITYEHFDLLSFYESEYDSLCNKYECISPHFGAHLGMTRNLAGTVIFSGDRLGHNSAAIKKNNLCVLEASKERSIVPYFFMHTPEIAYSAIYDHGTLLSKRFSTIEERYQLKCEIWNKSGFPVIPQDSKYTGFERVKDYYDSHYSHLVTPDIKIKYANKESRRVYDLLLRYPYEDRFGNPKFNYLFNQVEQNKYH